MTDLALACVFIVCLPVAAENLYKNLRLPSIQWRVTQTKSRARQRVSARTRHHGLLPLLCVKNLVFVKLNPPNFLGITWFWVCFFWRSRARRGRTNVHDVVLVDVI